MDPVQVGAGDPGAATVMPKCPRCNSYNTKFCFENNNKRYFCKDCWRYWTQTRKMRNNVTVAGAGAAHNTDWTRALAATLVAAQPNQPAADPSCLLQALGLLPPQFQPGPGSAGGQI